MPRLCYGKAMQRIQIDGYEYSECFLWNKREKRLFDASVMREIHNLAKKDFPFLLVKDIDFVVIPSDEGWIKAGRFIIPLAISIPSTYGTPHFTRVI